MQALFKEAFRGKTVLVTGHTGFKGSWLSIWLRELGANVIGFSLAPARTPNNFELTNLGDKITSIEGDIRDLSGLKKVIKMYSPQIVFHLAAQAIVLHSYTNPHETFETNAMGTVNILEGARESSIKAMVLVTTDKCYRNNEWMWGYRENDHLGGNDPYSASKAMAELAIHSYNASFSKHEGPCLASARAGNVIGGGDFSDYRLVPDMMKALLNNQPIKVRNPSSIRPWLHVLDPLCGYLQLAVKLLEKKNEYNQAWNFGPLESQGIAVQAIVNKTIQTWGEGSWIVEDNQENKKEMNCLRLNWDKASHLLNWRPLYTWQESIQETVKWFKTYESFLKVDRTLNLYDLCVRQIINYMESNRQKGDF